MFVAGVLVFAFMLYGADDDAPVSTADGGGHNADAIGGNGANAANGVQPTNGQQSQNQPVQVQDTQQPQQPAEQLPTQPGVRDDDFVAGEDVGTVIYMLTEDASVQNLAIGTVGNRVLGDTLVLIPSGGPTLTIVEGHPQIRGNAIRVSGRDNGWYTVDVAAFLADVMDLREYYYLLYVVGMASPGTEIAIRGMDSPWGVLYSGTTDSDGLFYFGVWITDEILRRVEGGIGQFTERGFRIQPNNLEPFTLNEVLLIRREL